MPSKKLKKSKPRFWDFKTTMNDEATLNIYGYIGDSFWSDDGITAKQFKKELDAIGKVKKLNIYINSVGGNVFDGQAIYTTLRRHESYKTVYIDGIAASIASAIAMVGDRIIMPENALMMLHRAWVMAMGNSDELQKIIDTLSKVDNTLVEIYKNKTGMSKDQITELMSNETWMTGEEALDYGFIDEVEEGKQIAASANAGVWTVNGQQMDLSGFRNLPKALLQIEAGSDIPAEDMADVQAHLGSQWGRTPPREEKQDATEARFRAIGRILSAANEQKLRDARDAIDEVIQQVAEGGGGDEANSKIPPPEPQNKTEPEEKKPDELGLLALCQQQIRVNKNRRGL